MNTLYAPQPIVDLGYPCQAHDPDDATICGYPITCPDFRRCERCCTCRKCKASRAEKRAQRTAARSEDA